MKKGDLRKDAIVKTGERLFFEKGYDETAVQDILDALSLSKGGFYHYFDSKIALLEEICERRTLAQIERLRSELFLGKLSPVQKLNLLLGALYLFGREDPEFIALVLRISYREGDVHFREKTHTCMLENLRPMLDGVILEGMADASFFTRHPEQIGRLVLMLGYDVNDEACRILAGAPDNPDCVIEIADMLNVYRDSIEALLGAPFGSVRIFDVEHLLDAFRQTAECLKKPKE